MDCGTVSRRVSTARRVRPGSMIATRMQVFETAGQLRSREDGRTREKYKPMLKASSMSDLMGGASGRGLTKATPTASSESVVCNPSTGQAVALPTPHYQPSSSLLTCVRAHHNRPRPQLVTPPRVASTSSIDSDYSSSSQLSPTRDDITDTTIIINPGNEDLDPPQTSPTTGVRGTVGNLKQLFEAPRHHATLSRATSLPFLSQSQAPFPKAQPKPPHPVPVSKASTLPHHSCLKTRAKVPLLPPPPHLSHTTPTTKHVRIIEPHSTATLPWQPGARRSQRKAHLLPPTSHPANTRPPPPKPPRAANRMELHRFHQV